MKLAHEDMVKTLIEIRMEYDDVECLVSAKSKAEELLDLLQDEYTQESILCYARDMYREMATHRQQLERLFNNVLVEKE